MDNETKILQINNQIKQLENQRDALINQDKKANVIDQSTMCLSAEPMEFSCMAMLCCRKKGHLGKHRHDMLGSVIEWPNKTFNCKRCECLTTCEHKDCDDCEQDIHDLCRDCYYIVYDTDGFMVDNDTEIGEKE